jgi:ClpP class serine protease
MTGYATARQNGWMSANDIRELENLDRIPAELGGDLYLINGAMTKLAGCRGIRKYNYNRNGGTSDGQNKKAKSRQRRVIKRTSGTGTMMRSTGVRTLYLDGTIADESWWDDEITPRMFKDELFSGSGDIVVWINSPGGDCVAASQIYAMLMDYPHEVTVKIDGIAASAASSSRWREPKCLWHPRRS